MQYLDPEDIRKTLDNIIFSKNIPPKAKEAIYSKRIIQIVSRKGEEYFWIFRGRNRDYIIIPGYSCTCKDFIIRVISENNRRPCYHMIAQKVAEEERKYIRLYIEDDSLIDDILLEILWYEYSPTLRRILIARASDKRSS